MHIDRVKIRNFRNFNSAELRFQKGVNTLIGENGSGKTNAFQAIRLLLDDTLSRKSIQLRDSDFNRANGRWKGEWIIINIDFAELDSSEGCQILKHTTGHMTGVETGTYTFYFRPKKEVRKQLFETSQADPAQATTLIDALQLEDYESIFTGRATADFSDDAVYHALAGNFATLTYPNPELDDSALLGTRVLQPIHSEVSCTFVKALRDVVNDLRNYRDSPLLNLLRGTEKSIALADSERIRSAIDDLNKDISGLDEIRQLSLGIQDSLHDTVGYSYSPAIDIQSSLPSDIERLLQSLALKVSDPLDEGYSGDLGELSLGGANLIYLSLKLLEYEMKVSSDRVAHFLLIEEPESHIHTHIQKTLFEKYGYNQTQVIVSTHSTHISAASKIRSVNVLAKQRQMAVVYHPSNGMSPEECDRIERYLDAVRSTLLFAKGVMLVEGDAEQILIPTLVRKVLGVSIDELGVSLISMSSSVFTSVAQVFGESRLQRRCAIITDLDEAFIQLPDDPKQDDDEQKAARHSQVSGQNRYVALQSLCTGNNWLDAFFAQHTFEVDLLIAGNTGLFKNILQVVYARGDYIAKSSALIESGDIAISGTEVLRLANKQGKGWFALQLAELITPQSSLPEYITNALAFSCEKTLDVRTIDLMLRHRLCEYEKLGVEIGPLKPCLTRESKALSYTTLSDDMVQLRTVNPQDPLLQFFSKVTVNANYTS